MAFTRGDPADYDGWAQNGAMGWSYADVLPYFKRSQESWEEGETRYRGGSGPIGVEWAKTRDPLFSALWDAADVCRPFGPFDCGALCLRGLHAADI